MFRTAAAVIVNKSMKKRTEMQFSTHFTTLNDHYYILQCCLHSDLHLWLQTLDTVRQISRDVIYFHQNDPDYRYAYITADVTVRHSTVQKQHSVLPSSSDGNTWRMNERARWERKKEIMNKQMDIWLQAQKNAKCFLCLMGDSQLQVLNQYS